jgi:glycosyltransferase involved in cell wall biosynthesis
MVPHPWLSVITPIFNGEAYLSAALDSIVIQGDGDIECIAIDGESTDATLEILDSYQDRIPLRIGQRERNSNWVSKTNYALSLARGEYVCFLHHDDLWFRDRLKTMRQLTNQFPEATLFLHPSNYLDNKGNILGTWKCPLPAAPTIIKSSLMTERLLVQNFISILGPVFKRQAALEVAGLDELLWYTADWDFWLKLAAYGTSVYYPKPLSGFRIHPSSQTIVRSSGSQEFREQLEVVASKHFIRWQADEHTKRQLKAVIDFSVEVNIALAGAAHGKNTKLRKLLVDFILLGPSGGYRYLRDSRIWERASARLKARVRPLKRPHVTKET